MDKETLDFMLAVSSTKFEPPRTLNSRSDNDYGGEDEEEEIFTTTFPCPWCPEELDLVVLCCHIDEEHYGEGRTGLCPVCAQKVGVDMIGHITANHANILKIQHKLQVLNGENSALSTALKKELEDEHLKCLIETSSYGASSSAIMDADPLLSSFMYNIPCFDLSGSLQPTSSTSTETIMSEKMPDENKLERKNQQPPLSDKDQEEKARKSEFVQGLLWSTIFDDNL